MRTAIVDPLADAGWRRLLETAPQASVFQHPAWLRLLRGQYRYPVAAACVVHDGEAVAGLPLAFVSSRLTGRRLVALPFSDRCPALLAPGAPAGVLAALAGAVEEERARRGVPLEVRAELPGALVPRQRGLLHVIDLAGGADAVRKRWSSMTRRNVKKARKAGVSVEHRTDREALDAFYALHTRTRRRLGVPTQPKAFIRGLEPLMADGLGFVALAHHDGRTVAAAVFLGGGPTLTYKYGASDERFLQARPNNLLFAETIERACADGYAALDLGRTDLASDGLASFKRSWGADETPLVYSYAASASAGADGSGRAEQALAAVIRRSPPVVSRLTGELLYRHVG